VSVDDDIAKALAGDLLGPGTSGIRKLCMDHKRCGLGMLCEHAQNRGVSCDLVSAWSEPKKHGECDNYFPRTELGSTGDVPRKRAGTPRTNQHAPDRQRARQAILDAQGRPMQPPDLQVSRHIKKGKDIKGDDS
jgi:hypothetical protein